MNTRARDGARWRKKGTRTGLGSSVLLLESLERKAQMSKSDPGTAWRQSRSTELIDLMEVRDE